MTEIAVWFMQPKSFLILAISALFVFYFTLFYFIFIQTDEEWSS